MKISALDKGRATVSRRNLPEKDPVSEAPRGTVYRRTLELVATPGSQRRCYDGCFHPNDWKKVWTGWMPFESNTPENRLTFWQELSRHKGNAQYKWEPNSDKA